MSKMNNLRENVKNNMVQKSYKHHRISTGELGWVGGEGEEI